MVRFSDFQVNHLAHATHSITQENALSFLDFEATVESDSETEESENEERASQRLREDDGVCITSYEAEASPQN